MIAYILFDISYTILDAPAFAVTTVMTSDVQERTSIIAGGNLWGMVGGVVAALVVPTLRPILGWSVACVVFVAVAVILMIPMLFNVKDDPHEQFDLAEKERSLCEKAVYSLLFDRERDVVYLKSVGVLFRYVFKLE